MKQYSKWVRPVLKAGILALSCGVALGADKTTVGSAATGAKESVDAIGGLVVSLGYVAGLIFFVGGVFKFKQHRDNPTQIPVGTPIALLCVSAALVFMPSVINMIGSTTSQKGGDALPAKGTV